MKAYVQNMRGEPLMPTNPAKARHLLENGRAEVVQRKPFTIRLKYATGENRQPITLGVDAGYSRIGFSAVAEKEELISGEVELRTDVSDKLKKRKNYRRNRRGRKRHRKPRPEHEKKKGWLPPSIRHKLETHIRLVEKIKKTLPVTKTVVEVASFDTQKMQNPEVKGVEYQHGTLYGYEVKEYLLEKWGRKCAYCGKTNTPLEVDHVVPKSRGGTDRVSNLTISCHKCNQLKGKRTAEEFGHPEVQEQAKEPLKATAFMNNVRWRLVERLDCRYTYGYVTKHDRNKLGLEKSNVNDAFIIAGGKDQRRAKPFRVKQATRNNRALQKNRRGYGISIRRKRYKLQPHDLVCFEGEEHRVKGVFNYGKWIRLATSKGTIVNTKMENVELIKYGQGLQFN